MSRRMHDVDYAVVPEDYEIPDVITLAERLGFERDTILIYLNRRSFHRIPKPGHRLRTGPLWYEGSIREWKQQNRKKHGKPQRLTNAAPP